MILYFYSFRKYLIEKHFYYSVLKSSRGQLYKNMQSKISIKKFQSDFYTPSSLSQTNVVHNMPLKIPQLLYGIFYWKYLFSELLREFRHFAYTCIMLYNQIWFFLNKNWIGNKITMKKSSKDSVTAV